MKLEATEGCTTYWYGIDGESVADLTDKNSEKCNTQFVREVICKALQNEKCDRILLDIFQMIITQVGECKYEYTCDDCGDSVYSYNLEI